MVQYLHFRFLIFSLIMWMCQVKTGYRKKEMLGSEHDQNMTNTKDGCGFWHFRLIGPANIKIDLTTPMFAPRELHLQHLHSDTWANVWFTLLYSTIISDYTLWINVNHWVVPLTHLEKHHDVSFFTSTNSIKFPHRGQEIGQIISNLFFFPVKTHNLQTWGPFTGTPGFENRLLQVIQCCLIGVSFSFLAKPMNIKWISASSVSHYITVVGLENPQFCWLNKV